jgi:hypothetical protein
MVSFYVSHCDLLTVSCMRIIIVYYLPEQGGVRHEIYQKEKF